MQSVHVMGQLPKIVYMNMVLNVNIQIHIKDIMHIFIY